MPFRTNIKVGQLWEHLLAVNPSIIFLLSCDHMGLGQNSEITVDQSHWACGVVKQCSCCHVIKCLQNPGLLRSRLASHRALSVYVNKMAVSKKCN